MYIRKKNYAIFINIISKTEVKIIIYLKFLSLKQKNKDKKENFLI